MGPVEAHESTCHIKAELLYSYQTSLAEYSRTVTFLYKHIGRLPKHDYDEINAFCEKARQRSEAARLDLDDHTVEHGC